MAGCGLAALAVTLAFAGLARANTFTVTRGDDPTPGSCTPSDCSLREAVNAANAIMGSDTIVLPARTYVLSRGPLPDVTTDDLQIQGAGPSTTVIMGGHAAGPGTGTRSGAISASGVNLSISGITVAGNEATVDDPATEQLTLGAGGIVVNGGSLSVVNSVIRDNQETAKATVGAGGLVVNSGSLTIVNSTISGNTMTVGGTTVAGGVLVNSSSSATIASSTVIGNRMSPQMATSSAGGVLSNVTPLTMTNSTVSGNTVDGTGTVTVRVGGVYSNVSDATLTHATIAGNSAAGTSASGGNLFAGGSGTRDLRNTIVAGGSSPTGANCGGTWTSQGGNVESTNECGLDPVLGDQPNTDPQLGPLQNNGGPTATRAIPLTSPAFDAARFDFCEPTDQRGVARPQGTRCDSGAFELGPPLNTRRPTIAGVVRVGLRVTCRAGTWTDAASFAFRWLRDGAAIAGATAQTYKLAARDAGHAVQCRVIATNPPGSTAADSAPRAVARACIVPQVKGVKLAKGRQRLVRAGCTPGKLTTKFSSTVKSGRIVSSKPGAGKNLPAGAKVALALSRGPKP